LHAMALNRLAGELVVADRLLIVLGGGAIVARGLAQVDRASLQAARAAALGLGDRLPQLTCQPEAGNGEHEERPAPRQDPRDRAAHDEADGRARDLTAEDVAV